MIPFRGQDEKKEEKMIRVSMESCGLPWWLGGKESTCRCWRPGFNRLVGKISWRRKWQPHSSSLAWEIPWTEEPGGATVRGVAKNRTRLSKYTVTWNLENPCRKGRMGGCRDGGDWVGPGVGKGLCVEAAAVDSRKFYKGGDEIGSRTQSCGDVRREHRGPRKH